MGRSISILILFTFISIKSLSQIVFEKGYFIDDSNQKTECLIKDIDWSNNPTDFKYKLSADGETQRGSIQTVKEFGIGSAYRFVRRDVKMDRYGDSVSDLGTEKNPTLQEEQLFLRVLIEGKASLFLYQSGSLKRFFYQIDDSEIKQLIYRRYLVKRKIAENNLYRQQLFLDLKCSAIELKDVQYIDYREKNLEKIFVKYNECSNAEYIEYNSKKPTFDFFNLSLRPGLVFNSLNFQRDRPDPRNTDFGSQVDFRFGMELEFILPFNKNKWSIILEPTYRSYKAEESKDIFLFRNAGDTNPTTYNLSSSATYSSIDIAMGLRHYFFLNENSKLFTNISFIYDLPFSSNSSLQFFRDDISRVEEFEIKTKLNLGLGMGYKYKDKYSLEFRYHTNRDLTYIDPIWNSDYTALNLIFGISFF